MSSSRPQHCHYTSDEELPFKSHGNDSNIGNNVYRVQKTSGGAEVYARKIFFIPANQEEKFLREATRFVEASRHPHVIQLIQTNFLEEQEQSTGRFYIIMELADCSLARYLWKYKWTTGHEDERAVCAKKTIPWIGCLTSGVAYIHTLGFTHGNIKTTNILVKDNRVLLADFRISYEGVGKVASDYRAPEEQSGGDPDQKADIFSLKVAPDYRAPEEQSGRDPDQKADIFSLGAVFLEMLIIHSPLEEYKDVKALLDGGHSYAEHFKKTYESMDKMVNREDWFLEVRSNCRKMLDKEHDKRPTAADLDSAWATLEPSLIQCKCFEREQVSLE